MPTVHEWLPRPIVTLTSEFASWETQWHGPELQSFAGGVDNILKLQVEFRYKKPYGGSARYRVLIDTVVGADWIRTITDEIGFYPPSSDREWHSETREYQLRKICPVFVGKDQAFRFRISTQIEGAGHLPTGSGPGSLGDFSDPETKEFTAVFRKPELKVVEAHVLALQSALQDGLAQYRKHV